MAISPRNGVLPPNVHRVVSKAREYFYYQPGRGTKNAYPRVPLRVGPGDPSFWQKLGELSASKPIAPARSIGAMIEAFRGSADWAAYEASTQRDYAFYLNMLVDRWGALPAADLRPVHVLAFRDLMQKSPGSANHMIVVGKRLYRWAIPREYAETNPFRDIDRLKDSDDGHWPWPDWALAYVQNYAWPDLVRFVRLAVEVGQRESDIVRLGPTNRDKSGIWVRPKKTKSTRKAFWVPLLASALETIEESERQPAVFDLERRREPLAISPGLFYVVSTRGNAYTPESLRSRWNRWLATVEGQGLLARWSAWEWGLRERDGEDVPEGVVLKPTLHGLRSTAVVARRLAGYSVEQISNDIGMSISMVQRYSRFMDQRLAAEQNILLLDAAKKRSVPLEVRAQSAYDNEPL